jgi:hypothetical protein
MVELRPVFVTTAGDVPASTDIKLLAKVGDAIRRCALELRDSVFIKSSDLK